ncbi:MAG: sialate O-acetylesterase [Fibrobacter sp.]|nr:sialate O-acetylesterase [Fibrobacter sp.]
MNKRDFLIAAAAMFGLCTGGTMAEPSKNFKVFLCFGQSNMSGGMGAACAPDAESKVTHPRVKVLGFATSTCGTVSRTLNKWSDACEPMHCGDGVNMMGPSYVFGRVLADSLPNDTIGLIPAGCWGASIELFMKGGHCNASQYFKPTNSDNARDWLITKCQEGIKRGVFSGIILEQGESNSGDGAAWLTKVKSVYDDLKQNVPFGNDVPFVAGELLANGDGKALNTTIDQIPQKFTYGYVASSQGLAGGGDYPTLHFNSAGYRTLGVRFGVEMMKGLRKANLITSVKYQPKRIVSSAVVNVTSDDIQFYTFDGKTISTANVKSTMKPGNVYIVSNRTTGTSTKLIMAPAK